MHTSLNDGTATVREVLDYVRDHANLDVIAITDHDRLRGSLEAMELASAYPTFHIVPGVEVTTLHGHLLALFVSKHVPMWRSLEWTIGFVHEQGGIVVTPHPFSVLTRSIGQRTFERIMQHPSNEIYFDAIESFNPSAAGRLCAAKVQLLNRTRFHLPEVGASDAHHLEGIGTGFTVFPGSTPEELRRAIRDGTTKAGGAYWDFPTHREIARLKFQRIGRLWIRTGRRAWNAVRSKAS